MGERLVSGRWVPAQLPEGVVDAILCHCDDDQAGHEPGADGCTEVTIKSRRSTPFSRTEVPYASSTARGTCRGCGRRKTVKRVEIRGEWAQIFPRLPGEPKAAYERRRIAKFGEHRAQPRGPLLQVEPQVEAHDVAGVPCPGAGQPPAETRYAPGHELAAWTRANGPDAVA